MTKKGKKEKKEGKINNGLNFLVGGSKNKWGKKKKDYGKNKKQIPLDFPGKGKMKKGYGKGKKKKSCGGTSFKYHDGPNGNGDGDDGKGLGCY